MANEIETSGNFTYLPMSEFPKDGARCILLCKTSADPEARVIVTDIWWGQKLMGKGFVLRGSNNELSNYLIPIGWRKKPVLDDEN